MKLEVFHQYNDYSGSPKVLRSVLDGLTDLCVGVDIFTSENGVLEEIKNKKGVRFEYIPYQFKSGSKLGTLINFLRSNFRYFVKVIHQKREKSKIIYINTLMPFGAAVAGHLKGIPVFYHYHENAREKGRFYRLLLSIMLYCADKIVCVSETQASSLGENSKVTVIHNGIDDKLRKSLEYNPEKSYNNRSVLMLASLKTFKGVNEFCELAKSLPQFSFTLVLNEDEANCRDFVNKNDLEGINNLTIYPRQKDVSKFYKEASILLNLSNKRMFVETFGMTVLEGMSAGLPCIVPEVGGPAELIEDGINGFKIDVANLGEIKNKICEIFSSKELYIKLSEASYKKSEQFSMEKMVHEIYDELKSMEIKK